MIDISSISEPRGLRLAGEVDLANTDELGAALEPHVKEGGDITLDVSELRFIDSSGVQVLVRALLSLEGRGRLILLNPGESLQHLIRIMGLDRFSNLEVRG